MEHVNKIPESDIDALVYSYQNMGIEDLANTFNKVIVKNCLEQIKDLPDIDGKKILPTLPVLLTDGNGRSHKEKLDSGWGTIYNDKNFSRMFDIVNKRIVELRDICISLPEKKKKKIYNRMKKRTSLKELCELQNKINPLKPLNESN